MLMCWDMGVDAHASGGERQIHSPPSPIFQRYTNNLKLKLMLSPTWQKLVLACPL